MFASIIPAPGRGRVVATVGIAVGLVVVVVGTFLPWLRSGTRVRSSYETAGVLRSLVNPDGLAGVVLRVWPFVSGAAAVAIALLVLQRAVLGAIVAGLAALASGSVAVATIAAPAQGLVRPERTGPVVTLLGSAVAIFGIAITLILLTRKSGGNP